MEPSPAIATLRPAHRAAALGLAELISGIVSDPLIDIQVLQKIVLLIALPSGYPQELVP